MTATNPYLFHRTLLCRYVILWRVFLFLVFIIISLAGNSQNFFSSTQSLLAFHKPDAPHHFVKDLDTISTFGPGDTLETKDPGPEAYDEILITLNVLRIGSFELPAIVYGEVAYLPIKDLFDVLRLKNNLTSEIDSIYGYILDPKASYIIDKPKHQITYQNKLYKLRSSDIIRTETGLYMKTSLFGQVFGLDCNFSFRNLAITLTTKLELPAIREMQQDMMRKNLSKIKGERKADTIIKRSFPFFRMGMADWQITSVQETGVKTFTRFNLGIGAVVAGGETNLFLNHTTGQEFHLKDQYYYWRYVNNDNKVVKQVTAGKIIAQPSSTITSSITGIQLTNTPTSFRRSFGTYTLSDKTEPGWTIELYINNVLVNYTKADASGFFTFEVPMVYGQSNVKLRFYGPWGEELTREQNLTIPFNFLPQHQFEYNISAGIVNDEKKSIFSRAVMNYGLGKRITIGAGTEYLASVTSGKNMPFVNASMRLGSNILVNGEHIYGVRSKGLISYRMPSNLRFEFNYTRYQKEQKAIYFNYIDERRAVISMPFRGKKMLAFTRLSFNQFTLPAVPKKTRQTTAELLLSAVMTNVSSNLTTYAVLTDPGNPLVYSNLSLTFRLPKRITLTPQAQYEYRHGKIGNIKLELEKSIFREGYLNISYEKNILLKSYNCGIGLRFNFSFAQTSFSARRYNTSTIATESARGSLLYDTRSKYLGINNQSNVGKGALIISPFLDLNCNGKRETNEPKAEGLKLRVNGGRIERNDRDTTIGIIGLEAYSSYFIELDKNSFGNVAWQMKKLTIKVNIDPNHFQIVDVPVAVVAEVSGNVQLKDEKGIRGIGRIIVNIYDSNSILVARTITESDGYFSYLGLAPGEYTAKIDPVQKTKLKMTSSEDQQFKLVSKKDGDIADGLTFLLESGK